MKKFLSVALAASMVLGLAACGNGNGDEQANNTPTPKPTQSAQTGGQDNSGSTDNNEEKKPDLKKLTIMLDNTVQFADPAHGGAEFEAALEKLMGVDVEIIKPDHTTYYDTVSQTFANPDESQWPDVVLLGSTYYVQYAKNGILADITDIWNASDLKASGRITNEQVVLDNFVDGRLYGIAPARGNGCVTYVKQDWLDRAGITKLPTTYAEYTAMLDAFSELSPDGYALTSAGLINKEAPYTNYLPEFFWDAYPDFYQNEDGVWVDGFTEDKMLDAFERLQEGFEKGWIDKEYATNGTSDCRNKFYADKCGVFTYWAGTWAATLRDNLAAKGLPTELVALEPIEEVGNYTERYAPMWAITSACENPEQAFDLFFGTMLDGGEGQVLFTYGIEDLHWSTKGETIVTGSGDTAKVYEFEEGQFHFRASLEDNKSLYKKHHIDPMLAIVKFEEGKDPGAKLRDPDALAAAEVFNNNSVIAPKIASNELMNKYQSAIMALRIELVNLVASGDMSPEDAMARYTAEQGANVEAILNALNSTN